jgi:glyoxylase-like metal-dependent hydrolase (beta-lactamase superfamily II)
MAYTQVEIGNVAITTVIEQRTLLSPDDYFPTGSIERLAGHGAWLKPWALDQDDQLKFVIQALCVQDGDQKIIVDTCVGPRTLPEAYAFIVNDGSFIDTLTQAGFGRDEVDLVICTHLHFDHVGWNTILEDGNWVPTFRRARYVVARPEFEHWQATTPEFKASSNVFNLDDATMPLLRAGAMDLVETDHRVTRSLQLVPTPGHTPGHVSVRIRSAGQDGFITGDCAHHPVQFAETDWHSLADMDAAGSSNTRRWVVEEFKDRPVLIIGTHFPPPSAGHLVTTSSGVEFRPVIE